MPERRDSRKPARRRGLGTTYGIISSEVERLPTRDVLWAEDDLVRRLRRVEGQVRGVEAMIVRGAACRDILTQLAAAEGALSKVTRIVEACRVAEGLTETAPEAEKAQIRERLGRLIR